MHIDYCTPTHTQTHRSAFNMAGFCSPTHLWDSLFCSMRTFFPSSFFHPALTALQFPAALLSSLFSLLHLSFLAHFRGVRFLQLVHISTPISRTHISPSLHPSSSSLSLLVYLTLTFACPGWSWGLQRAQGSELILIHSCNVSLLLHS